MRLLKLTGWILLIVFVLIQFIRPEKNVSAKGAENDISKVYTIPAEVELLFKEACYDCHSNNTSYPWYAAIQPFAWWMDKHVKEGKAELNFSTFAEYSSKRKISKLKSIAEQVKEGTMPLKSYTLMHSSAKFTQTQKDAIVHWINSIVETNHPKN